MKTFLCFFFFLITHFLFSQDCNISFYHNTESVKIKSLKAFTVSGGDTIQLKTTAKKIIFADSKNKQHQIILLINDKTINYKEPDNMLVGELAIIEIDDTSQFTKVPNKENIYAFGNYSFLISPDQKNKKLYSFIFTEGPKQVNGNVYSRKTSGYTVVVE